MKVLKGGTNNLTNFTKEPFMTMIKIDWLTHA